MKNLNPEQRMQGAAVLRRLLADGDYFDVADAKELIELVPIFPQKHFSFTSLFSSSGAQSDLAGTTAQGGGTSFTESNEKSTDNRQGVRLAEYLVEHIPGKLNIEYGFPDPQKMLDDQGQARLRYDKITGDPLTLEQPVTRWLHFAGLSIGLGISYRKWKAPFQS